MVKERPSHVNTTKNFGLGDEGCLVGVVLHRMGISTRIKSCQVPGHDCAYSNHHQMQAHGLIDFDAATGAFLDVLMRNNDGGFAWQICLEDALVAVDRSWPQLLKETISQEVSEKMFEEITTKQEQPHGDLVPTG